MIISVLCSIDSLAYLCDGILPFLNIFFTEFGQRSKLKEDQLTIAANIYSAMKVWLLFSINKEYQCFDTLMTQCIMSYFAVSAFTFPVLTNSFYVMNTCKIIAKRLHVSMVALHYVIYYLCHFSSEFHVWNEIWDQLILWEFCVPMYLYCKFGEPSLWNLFYVVVITWFCRI